MLVKNQKDLKLANKRYGQSSTRFGWAGRNEKLARTADFHARNEKRWKA